MKTNMKLKGFTLIELLVVIVIIGILATISVATFSGYFQKARDAERLTAVQNASTILKTAYAVGTLSSFDVSGTTLSDAMSSEGSYALPAAVGGYTYSYADDGSANFAFVVCSEENAGSIFTNGTADAVRAVNAGHAATAWCATADTDPTDGTFVAADVTAGYVNTAATGI